MVISILITIDNESIELSEFHRRLRASIDALSHSFEAGVPSLAVPALRSASDLV